MSTHPPFRITGAWVLKAFFVGFGVVFAANAVLIYFALHSWSGLETKNPYEKGLTHNTALAEAEEQAKLGWTVDVEYQALAGFGGRREGNVVVSVRDAQGLSINGLDGHALFWRPTSPGNDQVLDLESRGDGEYSAYVVLPAAGQWDVRLELSGGPRSFRAYRIRRRLSVP